MATTRTLTQIEQSIVLPTGTSIVTWVVYERTGTTGSLTKIHEKAVPTTGTGTVELRSSGPVDVALVEGHEYLIGFFGRYNPVTSTLDRYPSFGLLQGSAYSTASTLPGTISSISSTSSAYHQQLTTAPPG